MQIFACQQIAVNHYISNEQDVLFAGQVLDAIERYENESGITVEYIATCNDDRCLTHYDNVYYTSGQINERTLGIVSYSLLEYANRLKNGTGEGHRFERADMDKKIYKEYFKGKDFTQFNVSEQLVIIDNTAYWCAF